MSAHVLIAGGGPVGLVSALVLGQAGVSVTLVEASAELNRDLRASTFHPPTLDMLAGFGLTSKLVAQGLVARYTQQRDRKDGVIAEFDLDVLKGHTDHPFRLQCEHWDSPASPRRRSAPKPGIRSSARARAWPSSFNV